MEKLFALLEEMGPMSPGLVDHFHKVLKQKIVKKGDYLLRAGHICQEIFYVAEGHFMCYYEEKEKHICSWFMSAGEVIASAKSFFEQVKSLENIQALTEGSLIYITYSDLEYIYEHYPEFNRHGRILAQKYYVMADERLYGIRTKTAIERYEYLIKTHPEYLQFVKQKDIASYLGLTTETLSRIRGQQRIS